MRAPATCAAASQPRSSKAAAAGGREGEKQRGRGAPLRAQGQRCGRAASARAPHGSIEKPSVSFTNRRRRRPAARGRCPGGGDREEPGRGKQGAGEGRPEGPARGGASATPGCGDGKRGRKGREFYGSAPWRRKRMHSFENELLTGTSPGLLAATPDV